MSGYKKQGQFRPIIPKWVSISLVKFITCCLPLRRQAELDADIISDLMNQQTPDG